MADPQSAKDDWSVTPTAFDALLRELDPDRDQAGEKYQLIRSKLTNFFRWRGCSRPDECADDTIDRVTRKVSEGVSITTRDPYLYFHGVAINVLREYWKRSEREKTESFDEIPSWRIPGENPHQQREQELERTQREGCLTECMERLPRAQLELIAEYHRGEGGARIARRNELATDLGIPLNALRIRAYRIRGELESCIGGCTKKSEMDRRSGH